MKLDLLVLETAFTMALADAVTPGTSEHIFLVLHNKLEPLEEWEEIMLTAAKLNILAAARVACPDLS